MKKFALIFIFTILFLTARSQWNQNGDNSTTGKLSITSTAATSGIDIYNTTGAGSSTVLAGEGNSGRYIYMGYYNSSYSAFGAFKQASGVLYTGAPNGLRLVTDNSLSIFSGGYQDANERLRISSNGNIGIGTIAPDKTLTVSGEMGFFRSGANPTNISAGFIKYNDNGFIFGNSSGADPISFQTNSTDRLHIENNGNVGIGTSTPDAKLSLVGSGTGTLFSMSASSSNAYFKMGLNTDYAWFQSYGSRPLRINELGNDVLFNMGGGNVGIGTTLPDAKLAVLGSIHANEVKVDLNVPGPDYVFENNYKLPSLEELNAYIKVNKHLPEIPSACAMEENGVNLGEMNMLLLKKVEELTLYMIEQNNKILEQNNRLASQQETIKKQDVRITNLEIQSKK